MTIWTMVPTPVRLSLNLLWKWGAIVRNKKEARRRRKKRDGGGDVAEGAEAAGTKGGSLAVPSKVFKMGDQVFLSKKSVLTRLESEASIPVSQRHKGRITGTVVSLDE